MVTNPAALLIQYYSHLQRGEEDELLLADPRNDEDGMKIDISHLHNY
jgi:hypothetical protein